MVLLGVAASPGELPFGRYMLMQLLLAVEARSVFSARVLTRKQPGPTHRKWVTPAFLPDCDESA
ncbi:hypothetical protein GCM10020229_24460 [Kitasatospora albolonga]